MRGDYKAGRAASMPRQRNLLPKAIDEIGLNSLFERNPMFFVTKVEHALAVVAQQIVHFAKIVAPVIAKAQKAEPTVEAITALIDPSAVAAERAAFSLLGKVCTAVQHLGDAAAAGGINIELDAQELADIKALAAALQQLAQAAGLLANTTSPKAA